MFTKSFPSNRLIRLLLLGNPYETPGSRPLCYRWKFSQPPILANALDRSRFPKLHSVPTRVPPRGFHFRPFVGSLPLSTPWLHSSSFLSFAAGVAPPSPRAAPKAVIPSESICLPFAISRTPNLMLNRLTCRMGFFCFMQNGSARRFPPFRFLQKSTAPGPFTCAQQPFSRKPHGLLS